MYSMQSFFASDHTASPPPPDAAATSKVIDPGRPIDLPTQRYDHSLPQPPPSQTSSGGLDGPVRHASLARTEPELEGGFLRDEDESEETETWIEVPAQPEPAGTAGVEVCHSEAAGQCAAPVEPRLHSIPEAAGESSKEAIKDCAAVSDTACGFKQAPYPLPSPSSCRKLGSDVAQASPIVTPRSAPLECGSCCAILCAASPLSQAKLVINSEESCNIATDGVGQNEYDQGLTMLACRRCSCLLTCPLVDSTGACGSTRTPPSGYKTAYACGETTHSPLSFASKEWRSTTNTEAAGYVLLLEAEATRSRRGLQVLLL
jgi:hypothetical protein